MQVARSADKFFYYNRFCYPATKALVALLYKTVLLVLTHTLLRLKKVWHTHENGPCRNHACFASV